MEIISVNATNYSELEKYWRTLENGPDMTAYQLYDWYKNINQLYLDEHFLNHFRECIYVVAIDNGKPVMIAPIIVSKFGVNIYYKKSLGHNRGYYLIGRTGYSDYLNFIYDEFSTEAADAIFEYLKNKYGYKNCYFELVPENTQFYKYIHSTHDIFSNYSCYEAELVLPASFDDYKKKLSKNMRQNIRTAFNRQKKNNIELHHELILETDEELATLLYEIREKRLGQKQKAAIKGLPFYGKAYYLFIDTYRKLLCSYHDILKHNCNPWCFLVKDGDRIAGYFWGIRNPKKGVYYVILAGVEPDYAWYSPSISHFYAFIEELYENNNTDIKAFDFTRGGEKYKHDIGADAKYSYQVYFTLR
jgi:hypothetical protein